jgi:hypothetical protein
VPQPTAPPRGPISVTYTLKIIKFLKFPAGKQGPLQTQWDIYVAKKGNSLLGTYGRKADKNSLFV